MGVLQSWLKSERNYEAGLQLLRDHQSSAFVIELLEDGPDDYNTPKLVAEIEKLVAASIKVAVLKPAAALPVDPEPVPDQEEISDHDLEKSLRTKAIIKQLYKEIIHLRGRLASITPGPELFDCAKTILLKDLKRQDLWDHLHYFDKHGQWFDEQPENQVMEFDPKDKKQLEKKIKNLMANRTKAADHLKKPIPAGQKKFYQEKVAKLNKEIDQLKTLRNA